MICRSHRLVALILFISLLPGVTPASVDEKALTQLAPLPDELFWERVDDRPDYWLGGVKPHRESTWGEHTISLAAGEETYLRLPPGERARVMVVDGPPEAVQFFRGNATFLSEKLDAADNTGDGSRLVFGDAEEYTLLTLRHGARADGAAAPSLRLAVFVSRRELADAGMRYDATLPLKAPEVSLREGHLAAGESYWRVDGAGADFSAGGRRRLRVELRTIFPPVEGSREMPLEARLTSSHGEQLRRLHTAAEHRRPVWVDQQPVAVSRPEVLYFDLTRGERRLRLQTSMPALVRIFGESSDDWLAPGINARSARTPPPSAGPSPVEREQALRDGWRRGAVREAGLAAAERLRAAAAAWPDRPEVRRWLSRFSEETTFFRDLLPSRDSVSGEHHRAHFDPLVLRGLGEQRQELAASLQHRAALERLLPAAWFVPVSGPPGEPGRERRLVERRLVLNGDVLFDTNRDVLRADAEHELAGLLGPLGLAEGTIDVIGHTDSRASEAYNQDLSERRARRVADYLIAAGIAGQRLRARGRGELAPLADNDSAAGMQANRRVEITYRQRQTVERLRHGDAHYVLPERFAESTLRLAVHAPAHHRGEALFIQYDDGPPRELRVGPPPHLPADAVLDSTGALALRVGAAQSAEFGGQTHAGLFALNQPPAPLIDAGVAEFPLPAGVRTVRLWRAEAAGPPLYAALQYRAGKPFVPPESARPTETDAQAAQHIVAAQLKALASGFAVGADDLGLTPESGRWWPLSRFLFAARKSYLATLPADAARSTDGPDDDGQSAAIFARSAVDPLLALEALAADDSRLAAGERAFRQNELLLRLSEPTLAVQRWRAMAEFASSQAARAAARRRLEQIHAAQDNAPAQLELLAAAVARGDLDAVPALAERLLEDDEAALAWLLLELLDPAQRPPEVTIAVAYANAAWQWFDAALPGHPDPARRTYWQAYRQQVDGSDPAPRFAEADDEGRALAEHAQQAREILAQDATATAEQRLARASAWVAGHPGRRRWRDASAWVVGSAGEIPLRQIDRDRHLRMFLADDQAPLRLRFVGPRRLQIEARPLHPENSEGRVEGWLVIDGKEGRWLEPITDNQPAESLEARVEPPSRVGRAVLRELDFPAGWHEIAISAGALPILARIRQQEPLRPLLHLSPTTPDTAPLPTLGEALIPAELRFAWCAECSAIYTPGEPDYRFWQLSARAAGSRLAQPPTPAPTTVSDPLARLLAAGAEGDLDKLPPPASTTALRERAIAYLWTGEQRPAARDASLARLSAWAIDAPLDARLMPLLDRLARGSAWTPVTAVATSAGRRRLAADDGLAESPALRARHALLPPLAAHERRLAGEGQLVLAFDNPRPTLLALMLTAEELALPAGEGLSVRWQIDEQTPVTLRLRPENGVLRQIVELPAGRHTLRVGIVRPQANQFLRVGIRENGRAIAAGEHAWQVATATEPLSVTLPGPAWLRIDERSSDPPGERPRSHYVYLAEEWQTVHRAPQDGHDEVLLRLFLRRVEPGRPIAWPRRVVVPAQPVPPPPEHETPSPRAAVPAIEHWPPGGTDEGTRTWSLGAVKRMSFDDRAGTTSESDRYLELAATQRQRFADSEQTRRLDLLARVRPDDAPSLGGRYALSGPLGATPLEFALAGQLFVQRPPAATAGGAERLEGAVEFAASLRQRRSLGARAWHLPEAELFARGQSLRRNLRASADGNNLRYDPALLDHDVFSAYRGDHPLGLRIGDTYVSRPWNDALWFAGTSLSSNSDGDPRPDHFELSAGWRQQLGRHQWSADYRVRQFLADRDRRAASRVDALGFSLESDFWRRGGDRSALLFNFDFDLARGRGGFGVYWRMDFGHGRAFHDYAPREVDFRALRDEQRLRSLRERGGSNEPR